jgi:hypothetical protein
VRAQIVSASDLVIHQARLPDGSRKMMQISELVGYDADAPRLEEIFRAERHASGAFAFVPTGIVPGRLAKLSFYGVTIPPELFSSPAYEVRVHGGQVQPRAESRPELTVVPEPGAGDEPVPSPKTTEPEPSVAGPQEEADLPGRAATPGALLRRIAERQGDAGRVPLETRIARALGNPEPPPAGGN